MNSTKVCRKCGVEFPLSEFHMKQGTQDGKNGACKRCVKQYQMDNKERIAECKKQYYCANKEQISMQHSEYYYANKMHINEMQKKYREDNKDKITEYHKKYREDNKDEIADYHKKCYTVNKEHILERNKKYRENNTEITQKIGIRQRAKRRGWGSPTPINEWFKGAHLHHLHINGDHRIAIFIPATIHKYISHAHNIPESMIRINLEVLHWYYGLKICW